MIKGIDHVGISVTSLDRSIEFYRDLLGMEVVHRGKIVGGERYDRILALKGSQFRAARLKKGDLQVELFEFMNPSPQPLDPRYPVSDHGISHFGVQVADLEGMYKRLLAAGVFFHCPPMEFPGGTKATYVRDPDGNVFELIELSRDGAG